MSTAVTGIGCALAVVNCDAGRAANPPSTKRRVIPSMIFSCGRPTIRDWNRGVVDLDQLNPHLSLVNHQSAVPK